MKKIFFLAAAMVAAMAMNAASYSFAGIQSDAITVNANGKKGTCLMNEIEYPSVNYTAGDGSVMEVSFSGIPVGFQYKQGAPDDIKTKDNILKCHKDYLQVDGKNGVLVFSGLKIDEEVVINVVAKGSTDATFTVENGDADPSNPASVDKNEAKDLKFIAAASTMTIKETTGGFRIMSATIGAATGLKDLKAHKAAAKFIKDGRMYVRKADGKLINMLGF